MDDLVDHHDREDDGGLSDDRDLLRDVVERQDARRLVEEGPQQGREDDPDRMVAAQQCDGDTDETDARRKVQCVVVGVPEQLGQPHQSGDHAGQEHGQEDHLLDVDAARLGDGLGVSGDP